MKRFSLATRIFCTFMNCMWRATIGTTSAMDVIRVAQAAQDGFGHFGAQGVVAVEADSAGISIDGAAGRLGDVVQQHGETQLERRVRREHVEHDEGVGVNIAFGVPFRRLLAADHR